MFRPHVTLARLKEDGLRDVARQFGEEEVGWSERVTAVTLFETESDGSPYVVLDEVGLA
jgi:2'-5' RNA ligase